MCCAYSILILSGLKQLDPRKYFNSLGPVVVSAVWDRRCIWSGTGSSCKFRSRCVSSLGQAVLCRPGPEVYLICGRLYPAHIIPVVYPVWGRSVSCQSDPVAYPIWDNLSAAFRSLSRNVSGLGLPVPRAPWSRGAYLFWNSLSHANPGPLLYPLWDSLTPASLWSASSAWVFADLVQPVLCQPCGISGVEKPVLCQPCGISGLEKPVLCQPPRTCCISGG